MVLEYLPSPNERFHHFVDCYQDNLCALVFKITHDKRRGQLTFVRLYRSPFLVFLQLVLFFEKLYFAVAEYRMV